MASRSLSCKGYKPKPVKGPTLFSSDDHHKRLIVVGEHYRNQHLGDDLAFTRREHSGHESLGHRFAVIRRTHNYRDNGFGNVHQVSLSSASSRAFTSEFVHEDDVTGLISI